MLEKCGKNLYPIPHSDLFEASLEEEAPGPAEPWVVVSRWRRFNTEKMLLQQLGGFLLQKFSLTSSTMSPRLKLDAWFSSQTSASRISSLVGPCHDSKRSKRKIKKQNYSKDELFSHGCGKLCCPICILFASNKLPNDWYVSNAESVAWNATHTSILLPLIQPCVKENELLLQVEKMDWAKGTEGEYQHFVWAV